MSISVKLKNKKEEEVNEMLSLGAITLGALGLIALGKLLSFKFNFQSDDKMSRWSMGLGDAFNFSKSKLVGSNIGSGEKERINRILDTAQMRIKNKVERQTDDIKRNPELKVTVDRDIDDILSNTVDSIEDIVKDRRHSEEFVNPLRAKFSNLKDGLISARKESALNSLSTNPSLRSALSRAGISNSSRANKAMSVIAQRIARSVK